MPQRLHATREQARELDKAAIDGVGVKGLILMENAGRACALVAADMLAGADGARDGGGWRTPNLTGRRVSVFCGMGNNGGDGFVIARHLHNWGAHVRAFLLGSIAEALVRAGAAAVNLEIALNMDIPVTEIGGAADVQAAAHACDGDALIIDALLGTGLDRDVREPYRSAIRTICELDCPALAVDVPSGLDCDTGRPLGCAVVADVTVTFVLSKLGFSCPGAAEYTGRVEVAEISIPRQLIAEHVERWRAEGDKG